MENTKKILDYLNELSYIKKCHIKPVQLAKDLNISMYESSNTLEDLATSGLLLKRFEVIDKSTALNYGCFKTVESIPKEYITDDDVVLHLGENATIRVFYRFKNAHSFIKE